MPRKKNEASNEEIKTKTEGKDKASKKSKTEVEEKSGKINFEPESKKTIHQIMPWVFGSVAFVISVFYVLYYIFKSESIGVAGQFFAYFFPGFFGASAFLIPLVFINLAINWHRFIDSKKAVVKIIFQIAFIICLSSTIHVLFSAPVANDGFFDLIKRLYATDNFSELRGGGIIGGLLGELLFLIFNKVGSAIILTVPCLFFLIFSFGMSPNNIVIFMRQASKDRKENKEAKREQKLEDKKEKAKLLDIEKEKLEIMRLDREAKERDEQRELDEKIAIAEKKAKERELEEDEKDTSYLDCVIKVPEDEYKEPIEEKPIKKENRVLLRSMFENPKEEQLDGTPLDLSDGLVDLNKPIETEDAELELKPLTDIEGVPDDGQDADQSNIAEVKEMYKDYQFPPIEFLKSDDNSFDEAAAKAELRQNAEKIRDTLASFKIKISEITYSRGPTITRYELKPDAGVTINKIANRVNDIALHLATIGVRIEAPIPGKAAVGIEVPNRERENVSLRSLLESSEFKEKKSKLTACLGKDVGGNPIFFDIGKMPHMLIAGTTGSGKSVCINCIIMSLLYKASPKEVKLILIDPKKVEFNIYKTIPHLYAPIVVDMKKAAGTLASAVAEMERRFELIEAEGVRDIAGYNAATANDPTKEFLPYIVIVIDELADLMMTAPDDVETAICRIAQKARAAGIHLIIGTQRPSVDVVTGLIKGNIPSRAAFVVASQIDSRTILDTAGAEKLIGKGDMLFSPIGVTKPLRVQGAFVSDPEIENVVTFLNENNEGAVFNDEFMRRTEEEAARCGNKKGGHDSYDDEEVGGYEEGMDSKFDLAVKVAIEAGKISTSLLQRKLEVGYGRAAKLIDKMEELGYVSAPDGNKPRKVLVTRAEYAEKRMNEDQ